MAKSRIIIAFNVTQNPGEVLSFSNNQVVDLLNEEFVEYRFNYFQSQIGYDTYVSAYNYAQALITDYGNTGLYNITVVGNIVTIEAIQSNVIFTLIQDTTADLSIELINETETLAIAIDEIVFSTAIEDPVNKVKVNVSTNILATSYSATGINVYSNIMNPFSYVALRGITDLLTVNDYLISTANLTIVTPDILQVGSVYINLVNTTNGSTATIDVVKKNLLVLKYSLDNITWQSSNIFAGLIAGNYTVYVRDQFGAIINKEFSITVFTPLIKSKEEFSYISKAMSIRYKRNQAWDYNDIYKTPENTLSCEEDVNIAYKYKQKFKPTNVVKTQFLSNYSTISANVIKSNGTKTPLTVVKKINFLDIKDKRDARIYKVSTGKLGIYFTSGNTYNYTTNVDNGDYALNGSLPDYGVIGGYIGIGTDGWFKIEDIIYDDTRNADVLIVSKSYEGFDSLVVVYAEYNKKNFNVYEFTVDFSQYNNQEVQIEILQTSVEDGFIPYNYLSEIIEVSDYWLNTVEIKWANEYDTILFYSTGIHHIGNFEFTTFKLGKDSTLEIHKTPYTSVVIEANNYELRELFIEDVSTEIAQQLIQIALHKYICVNGLRYISNDSPELENLANTNLHSLQLNLLRLPPSSSYQAAFPG